MQGEIFADVAAVVDAAATSAPVILAAAAAAAAAASIASWIARLCTTPSSESCHALSQKRVSCPSSAPCS